MADLDTFTAAVAALAGSTGMALALGVIRDGELVHAQGWGRTSTGAPVDVDTPFPSCSTGKSVTATAVMRLVEAGDLDLDAPVRERLPALTYPKGGDAAAVTLRHLLSHTSGLSSDPAVPERFQDPKAEDPLRAYVLADVPGYAALPCGEVLVYSNPGFGIAGLLAAETAGIPFPALVADLVTDPLGMTSTSYDPEARVGAEVQAVLPEAQRGHRIPIDYPAGGAVTTVRDLCRLAVCHLRGGESVLSAETVALMHSVHADAYTRPPRYYGLGFTIGSHRGRKLVAHGGGGFGSGSTFVMAPDEDTAVVALFNHPAGYAIRATDVLDALWEDTGASAHATAPGAFASGDYRVAWPGMPGHPATLRTLMSGGREGLEFDGRRHALRHLEDSVWVTEDGKWTVGFVPGGDYLMADLFGIGLVSAMPYRRVDAD